MKNFLMGLAMAFSLISLTSCATSTVAISSSTGIVRIGPDVKGHVYFYNSKTKAWELSKNQVQLPQGWYATEFHGQ